MSDNIAAHASAEYDDKILATIPFYDLFHQSIIDLIQSINQTTSMWLDTGCGTGNFFTKARKVFHNTNFILADPSKHMLEIAKEKTKMDKNIKFILADSQSLDYEENTFDVITAVQCHHYLDEETRMKAVKNCFRMLKPNGIFITFENIMPLSEKGISISLKRWEDYQIRHGKTQAEAKQHIDRFGKEYLPISIIEHIDLLNKIGFRSVEILWASYMQAGFYAMK